MYSVLKEAFDAYQQQLPNGSNRKRSRRNQGVSFVIGTPSPIPISAPAAPLAILDSPSGGDSANVASGNAKVALGAPLLTASRQAEQKEDS